MAEVEPIYVDLASESEDPSVTQIESLCLACRGTGVTRLLMTKIPHYKEIIISSFECNDCGNKNTGVQPGAIQELGIRYEVQIQNTKDLSRQVVTSTKATLIIPELDFEIPPNEDKGEVTTVEGFLQKAKNNLTEGLESRKLSNIELAQKIEDFISKLQKLIDLQEMFTLIIDDPSGNSFIENLNAPNPDPQVKTSSYKRTKVQNIALGLQDVIEEEIDQPTKEEKNDWKEEVLNFNTLCSNCSRPCTTKMKVTDIPHFKEAIIMATECDGCGFKTNEVKGGGGISEKGKRFTLHIKDLRDMSRDVIKSDTCGFSIPELNIDVGAGVLVGKLTTVEGLLSDVKTDLAKNPFLLGDSTYSDRKSKTEKLLDDIQKVIDGSLSIHFILDDPAGNSYLQSLTPPGENDPQLQEEEYERSFEQNEELGLNDMKTEDYANS